MSFSPSFSRILAYIGPIVYSFFSSRSITIVISSETIKRSSVDFIIYACCVISLWHSASPAYLLVSLELKQVLFSNRTILLYDRIHRRLIHQHLARCTGRA